MIGVLAMLKVQDGKQAEFEAVFGELVKQVRANEPGCLLYSLTQKQGSPTEYVVMEQYKDQAALDAHGKTDYFRAAGPKMAPCMAGRPEIVRLDVKV
jgi:quinol monooxygenase YgiN